MLPGLKGCPEDRPMLGGTDLAFCRHEYSQIPLHACSTYIPGSTLLFTTFTTLSQECMSPMDLSNAQIPCRAFTGLCGNCQAQQVEDSNDGGTWPLANTNLWCKQKILKKAHPRSTIHEKLHWKKGESTKVMYWLESNATD